MIYLLSLFPKRLTACYCKLENARLGVLTFSACTPPLDQVLELWDFLFAFGMHLNVLCIVAQLLMIRIDLLQSPSVIVNENFMIVLSPTPPAHSPMKLLRPLPPLNARAVITLTISLTQTLPDALYDLLARHPYDDRVAAELNVRVGAGVNSLYSGAGSGSDTEKVLSMPLGPKVLWDHGRSGGV
ncbi:hypothetical protein BC938DRAFT_482916 [Jimgerdemannia flammicorona]|uniref:Rab-GTPase-TBC domain-containing protein n=1 Tax=Jimgerdemannia flammicorona TaxID=994334 RepID=A0A433R0B7_9FUNG|nr:hypothetical protein BC938DRAFT_482916 [Jimgerdemannia flammicorona]